MSDGDPTSGDGYQSAIDPAFSMAWNDVFSEEEAPSTDESNGALDASAGGDQAPAAPVEGTPAGQGSAPAPTDGAVAGVGDPTADLAGANTEAPATVPAATPGVSVAPVPTGVSYASVAPRFAEAATAIDLNIERSFQAQATRELEEVIGPLYGQAIAKHPRMLVGTEVPSLNGPGKETIRDSADAKEWQEAATQLISAEIADRVRTKTDDVRPMLNVLQESTLLFQNNSDLMPGTNEFDAELAEQFASLAKSYEHRINGKLFGYQVNVQPLINQLRSQLASQRGATGVVQQQRSAAQAVQAAQQARTPGGQFDGPQAGITSKAGQSGESTDDYGTFWQSVGLGGTPGGMSI